MTSKELKVTISGEIIKYVEDDFGAPIDAQYNDYMNNVINLTVNNIVKNMIEKRFDSVIHQLEIQRKSRNKVRKAFMKQNNQSMLLAYNLGKYDGVYSTMAEVIEKTVSQNQIDEIYNHIKTKKHLINIILYVYENPLVNHKKICDAIGVKPNYLSELMISLNKYGLINKYSFSKYTNYSLTEKGKKVYEFNKKNTVIIDYDRIKSLKQSEMEYAPIVVNISNVEKNDIFEENNNYIFNRNGNVVVNTKNIAY